MTALLKITQKMTTDNNGGKMAKELLDEKYLENQLREAFTEIAINKKNWKIASSILLIWYSWKVLCNFAIQGLFLYIIIGSKGKFIWIAY